MRRYSKYLSKTKTQTIQTPLSAESLTVVGNLTLVEALNPVSKQLDQLKQLERLTVFGDLNADKISFMRPVEVEKIVVDGFVCGLKLEVSMSNLFRWFSEWKLGSSQYRVGFTTYNYYEFSTA